MATYKINKGIDKPVEFYGLKAQYLVFFFLGMPGVLLAFTALYLLGFHLYGCVAFALGGGGLLTRYIFKWNRQYGQHGLMKNSAARKRPDYLVNRGRYLRYLKPEREVRDAWGLQGGHAGKQAADL